VIESNYIWSVVSYIWEWCNSTVWYEGQIFGVTANFTLADLMLYPVIGAILIWLIKLVFGLADE